MKESTKLVLTFWALVHVLCLVLACGNADDPDNYDSDPVSGGSVSSGSTPDDSDESAELKAIRDAVVTYTNDARATSQDCGQHGIKAAAPALQRNSHLDQAAQVHALDMATNEFVSHVGSDGSSFLTRVSRTNYTGTAIGENVGKGYRTGQAVVSAWIDSDGHCKNLMSSTHTQIGVGYAYNPDYGRTWVQVFGK